MNITRPLTTAAARGDASEPAASPISETLVLALAVLKAKIKIQNPRIRAGIGPKPTISLGKCQSGPSPGTPRGTGGKNKIKNHVKNSQVVLAMHWAKINSPDALNFSCLRNRS